MTRNLQPILVADYCCDTGECPTWHRAEQRLYWTDIPTGRVFRYDPALDFHEQCFNGRLVSGMTVQLDGSLIFFGEHGAVFQWLDGNTREIVKEISKEIGTRFNDVAADPAGRVFCGTMPSTTHPGTLYRLDRDDRLNVMVEGLLISNGIGFTRDQKTMFLSESTPGIIHAFDYEKETGALTNQRRFATVSPQYGVPDGLTVDAEDNVWSARWDGACVVRYSPNGQVDFKIDFPVPKVSSLIFGGPTFQDLYVTTAGGHQKNVDGRDAGALFVVKDAGSGVPDYLSNITVPNT